MPGPFCFADIQKASAWTGPRAWLAAWHRSRRSSRMISALTEYELGHSFI